MNREEIESINLGRRYTKRLKKDINEVYLCLMIFKTKQLIETYGIIASFGISSVSIYIPLFDMMKEVMWKSEFAVHRVHKIKDD